MKLKKKRALKNNGEKCVLTDGHGLKKQSHIRKI
jgi:hypothetical protein